MAVMSNPRLIEELERYGASDVVNCYHCGNCSAACPFSKEPFIFPRKTMRYLQTGLEDRLRGTLEPWLCYYCGECSDQCPRGAEPGETMMSFRRWLTAQYDFTGISRLLYTSWKSEVAAILVLALLTGAGLFLWGNSQGSMRIYDGPGAFLPSSAIHVFDWIMGGVLAFLLAANSLRMWWFTMGRDSANRAPVADYLRMVWQLPLHFLTQKRYRECDRKQPWAQHLVLMACYLTMLVLIMFFLRAVQSGPAINWWAHGFGYLASLGLLGTLAWSIRGRLRKVETRFRHSHESDWIFLGILGYVVLTGIVQHLLHRLGLPLTANLAYLAHMMGVVPMLVLEVPFSKWAHLAYRPLAMYLAAVQSRAILARRERPPVPAAAAPGVLPA